MTARILIWLALGTGVLFAQRQEPGFFTWHAFEYTALDNGQRDLTFQFHFRTHDNFRVLSLVRGSVFASRQLPRRWTWTGGYLAQNQETSADSEWARQQRVFTSISRPFRTARLRHNPRFQYDYLFWMPTPSYGRYRFAWQTEWVARVRPYAGAEEFIEHKGVQRFRPRAGLRFSPSRYVDADIVYMYDRIYLRGLKNRHIIQTTINFHRPSRD